MSREHQPPYDPLEKVRKHTERFIEHAQNAEEQQAVGDIGAIASLDQAGAHLDTAQEEFKRVTKARRVVLRTITHTMDALIKRLWGRSISPDQSEHNEEK
jgi:hypothetical protein